MRSRHAPVSGVCGTLYRSGGLRPVAIGEGTVTYDDPTVRWVKAAKLVRVLQRCTVVEVAALCRS